MGLHVSHVSETNDWLIPYVTEVKGSQGRSLTSWEGPTLLLRKPVRAATCQEKYGSAQFSRSGMAWSSWVVSDLHTTKRSILSIIISLKRLKR